ncbi:hypothetical protein D3C80_1201880 [compost metagenome]
MPPRTVSVESLKEIASTFKKGYTVMTRITNIRMKLQMSKILSDFVALNAFAATFCPLLYIMLSFVVFFMTPFATSSKIILTTEVNILMAVPYEKRLMLIPYFNAYRSKTSE